MFTPFTPLFTFQFEVKEMKRRQEAAEAAERERREREAAEAAAAAAHDAVDRAETPQDAQPQGTHYTYSLCDRRSFKFNYRLFFNIPIVIGGPKVNYCGYYKYVLWDTQSYNVFYNISKVIKHNMIDIITSKFFLFLSKN